MNKKIWSFVPIIFISISLILIYQTSRTRSEFRDSTESSYTSDLSSFDQLQRSLNKDLIDLGEALISFVHFDGVNTATVSTEKEDYIFPLDIVDSETNTFSLADIIAGPDSFIIGDIFGLAASQSNEFYYYSLD